MTQDEQSIEDALNVFAPSSFHANSKRRQESMLEEIRVVAGENWLYKELKRRMAEK